MLLKTTQSVLLVAGLAVILPVFLLFYPLRASAGCGCAHVRFSCSNGNGGCGGTITDVHVCCPSIVNNCKSWEKCDEGSGTCYCDGKCLKIPPNPKEPPLYYDNPVYENDPAHDKGNKDVTLPAKLDWIDDAWENKGGDKKSGYEGPLERSPYGTQSYWIKIENPDNQLFEPEKVPDSSYDKNSKTFLKLLDHEYFNSFLDAKSCFFNTASDDVWHVRACCNKNGTNCGPWTNWNFNTHTAAEPIAPGDPDWTGSCSDWTFPCTKYSYKGLQLRWCAAKLPKEYQNNKDRVEWATSYKLMAQSDEKTRNVLACHPLWEITGQCKADDVFADPLAPFPWSQLRYPVQGRQQFALFTRNRYYGWSLQTCFDEVANKCGASGQFWKLITKEEPIGIPEAILPKNDAAGIDLAGLPLAVSWTIPDGANSFIYQTNFLKGDQKTGWSTVPNNEESSQSEKDNFDAPNLKPDTQYKWRVRACAYFNSTDCDGWSEWFVFRTTGRPPGSDSMKTTENIPATFSWEAVPGAKSYNFSIFKSNGETKEVVLSDPEILKNPKYTLGYPDIDQMQSYSWKVQTCAHADGKICGAWSGGKAFTTGQLEAAAGLVPEAGSTIYADQVSQNISWNGAKNASAYHYVLAMVSSSEARECVQDPVEKTILRTSDTVELNCLGSYRLAVRPCIDPACASTGPESETNFVLSQRVPENKSAFALCGSGYDNPETTWNDRESCQPKHLLLLAKVVIDFAIFKLSLFLLPILALITGLLFYSPFNNPDVMEKTKTVWKAIGIGYAILIFAWIITGILLQIAGFTGVWWKV